MNNGKEILILNIEDVLPNRFQPRIKFNEKNILELADSIREHGVIQPIVVRKISDKYEIIAGERRYKASILAGKTTIPAIVTNFDDKQSAEVALIENVQRQDLTPIEEAISYKKILDMGYINQTDLAEKLGRTQSTIANKLRLLNLSDEVQEALLEGKISERHARSLLKLENEEQIHLLNRIIDERMTVRKTDEEIDKILNGQVLVKEETPSLEIIENEEANKKTEEFEIVDIESDDDGQQLTSPNSFIYNEKEENKNVEGEQTMNQNSNNIFNPFMEQFNNPAPQNSQPEQPMNQTTNDNIFNNPINQQPQTNDMGQINAAPIMNMEQNEVETPLVNNQPSSVNAAPVSNQQGGSKFFNIFDKKEESNKNYVEDLESKEVNMNFIQPEQQINPTPINNSIFNNPVMQSPFDNNIQSGQQNLEPIQPVQQNVNPFPIENQNEQLQGNNIQQPQQVQDMAQPLQQSIDPFNPNNGIPVANNDYQAEIPIMPINNNQSQDLENTVQFTTPIVSEQNVNQETQVNLNNPINNNINYNSPIQQNVDQDLVNNQLKPYSLDDEEEFINQGAVEMTSNNPFVKNEYMVNQEPPVVVQNNQENVVSHQTDLRTVINTIRTCSDTIEKYGYNIETEEIDFEDSYQVIFKIQK